MKTGSLRRSITLPDGPLAGDYSPDGLSETDIDTLLAEEGVDIDEPPEGEAAPVIALRAESASTQTGGEAA